MKNSDHFSAFANLAKRIGRLFATLAIVLLANSYSNAQDLVVMAGSVHSFSVENNEDNSFAWSYHDAAFNPMPNGSIDYVTGQFDTNVTVKFVDLDYALSQMVYMAVTESRPNGCSTRRALQILLEPNNMFLEFASAETQDCFNMGDFYAPLKVGLNFKDKGGNVPIPESRFPLTVEYTIQDKTNSGPIIAGNSGNPLTIAYSETNEYFLLVTDAVGSATQTTEYELTITSVTDKFQAAVKNNDGDIRLQIRIINHLPQGGKMDMAMAYVITPVR